VSVAFLIGVNSKTYSKGLAFTLSSDGTYYIVTGIGSCTDEELKIPPKYKGLPVTEIGRLAFEDCKSFHSVIIPKSVVSIRYYAFLDSGLTSAIFEDVSRDWGLYDNNLNEIEKITAAQIADATAVANMLRIKNSSRLWKKLE
jgi:hypothetical protein